MLWLCDARGTYLKTGLMLEDNRICCAGKYVEGTVVLVYHWYFCSILLLSTPDKQNNQQGTVFFKVCLQYYVFRLLKILVLCTQ